ncbi:hypothetical protein CDAR_529781 [Caerostris darwini]|uniref:Uncharacterized protein n=1 Tax=Caerostris darwini TaxID=1538125 RepID=A0AAV4SAA4_9ARAC|nr:hypothetical protein CDAR_529781 [Caerostris darwini]
MAGEEARAAPASCRTWMRREGSSCFSDHSSLQSRMDQPRCRKVDSSQGTSNRSDPCIISQPNMSNKEQIPRHLRLNYHDVIGWDDYIWQIVQCIKNIIYYAI